MSGITRLNIPPNPKKVERSNKLGYDIRQPNKKSVTDTKQTVDAEVPKVNAWSKNPKKEIESTLSNPTQNRIGTIKESKKQAGETKRANQKQHENNTKVDQVQAKQRKRLSTKQKLKLCSSQKVMIAFEHLKWWFTHVDTQHWHDVGEKTEKNYRKYIDDWMDNYMPEYLKNFEKNQVEEKFYNWLKNSPADEFQWKIEITPKERDQLKHAHDAYTKAINNPRYKWSDYKKRYFFTPPSTLGKLDEPDYDATEQAKDSYKAIEQHRQNRIRACWKDYVIKDPDKIENNILIARPNPYILDLEF